MFWGGHWGLGYLIHLFYKGSYFLNLIKGGLSGSHRHRELSRLSFLLKCSIIAGRSISFPGTSNQRSWCQLKPAAAPTAGWGRLESVSLCDPRGLCLCHYNFQVRELEGGGPGPWAQGEIAVTESQ